MELYNKSHIERLAKLSMLRFSESEIETLQTQIKSIDDIISKVSMIKCDLEPLISVNEDYIKCSKDEKMLRNSADQLFEMCPKSSSSPQKMLRHFVVPKVL